MSAEYSIVDIGPAELAVRDLGSGGVPLILLHGYLGGYDDWQFVHERLAEDRRVLAYDHRGFARSSNTGRSQPYSMDLLAQDLLRLVDRLGIERFDLVGHSMGGGVALRTVLAHPERVRSLVLVDTAARGVGAGGGIAALFTYGLLRALGPGRFFDWIIAPIARRVHTPVQDRLRDEHGERLSEMFRTRLLTVDPAAYRALGRELSWQRDLVPQLPHITAPTTVVFGTGDAAALRRGCQELADTIPGARLIEIEDADHGPPTENPEAFIAAVRDHLARVETTDQLPSQPAGANGP